MVAAFDAEIEQITVIISFGILGLGIIALQWRTALGDQIRQLERARRESRTDGLTGSPTGAASKSA